MSSNNISVDEMSRVLNYDPDTGQLSWKVCVRNVRPGDIAGTTNSRGYRVVTYMGKKLLAHRLAWAISYGYWPVKDIDHIDRDKLNNRLTNLRLASDSENQFNSSLRVDNKSGHKGVRWVARDEVWRAYIHDGTGRQVSLGSFKSMKEAVEARNKAERALGLLT